jgi:hypothetical protein
VKSGRLEYYCRESEEEEHRGRAEERYVEEEEGGRADCEKTGVSSNHFLIRR